MSEAEANGVRALPSSETFESFCLAFDKVIALRMVRMTAQAQLDDALRREAAATLVLEKLTQAMRKEVR